MLNLCCCRIWDLKSGIRDGNFPDLGSGTNIPDLKHWDLALDPDLSLSN